MNPHHTDPVQTFLTKRLIAERLQPSDYDDLCRMHSDPMLMATLGGVRSHAQTARFLRDKMAHWAAHGYGLWIFRFREGRQFAGRGLLEHIEVGGNQEIEVGFSVLSAYWAQGLATEMAKAILAIGFHHLDVESIVSFTLTHNLASQRVMQKAGFTFERTIMHVNQPHVLYRLTRKDCAASSRINWSEEIPFIG